MAIASHSAGRTRRMRTAILPVALCAAICISSVECDRAGSAPTGDAGAAKLNIVCSFLPVYVFAMNIVGDAPGVSVEMLLPSAGGCPHDYEASTADAKRLVRADVLVTMGVIDAGVRVTAERLGATAREVTASNSGESGAPSDSHRDHAHSEGHDHADDRADAQAADSTGHNVPGNPHIWVSPHGAIKAVRAIADGLAEVDAGRAELYQSNAAAYIATLDALATEVADLAQRVSGKRVVTVHDVFDDLAADLGLEIVATIHLPDGSAPSARRMHQVIKTIRATGAVVVFSEPQFPSDLAERIALDAGVPCRELDPVASAATNEIARDHYEQAMRRNLETLRQVLAP